MGNEIKPPATLTIGTEDGDVLVTESELSSITPDDLRELGMTYATLTELFAQARKLQAENNDPNVRPVADNFSQLGEPDNWQVNLVGYAEPKVTPFKPGIR